MSSLIQRQRNACCLQCSYRHVLSALLLVCVVLIIITASILRNLITSNSTHIAFWNVRKSNLNRTRTADIILRPSGLNESRLVLLSHASNLPLLQANRTLPHANVTYPRAITPTPKVLRSEANGTAPNVDSLSTAKVSRALGPRRNVSSHLAVTKTTTPRVGVTSTLPSHKSKWLFSESAGLLAKHNATSLAQAVSPASSLPTRAIQIASITAPTTQPAGRSFIDKLTAYNDALSKLRERILHARGPISSWRPISDQLKVIWGNRDDFVNLVARRKEVTTLTVAWTSSPPNGAVRHDHGRRQLLLTGQTGNMLLQKYYRWTATEPLCTWIRTKGRTKARWDSVYSMSCDVDVANASASSRGIEAVYMRGKPINVRDYWPNNGDAYPAYFYDSAPPHALYSHVMQDAVITSVGDVISGALKLVPYTCSQQTGAAPPDGYQHTAVYTEVFVITQFWGDNFFHKMLEDIPRLAPYMSFLRAHPSVRIHVAELGGYTADTARFLGLSPERFIKGVCRAKVVYLPQGTPCGFAQLQSVQLLSRLYRDQLARRFPAQRADSIVLVERSGARRFTQAARIHDALRSLAGARGFRFELFSDRPVPAMVDAMRLFSRALIVVAPHGAGLSNLVYSEPGAYVVEAVCNRPHVNMCYQWLAHVLGMRYHAVPSRRGCEDVIDVDADVIRGVVDIYAQQIVATLGRRPVD